MDVEQVEGADKLGTSCSYCCAWGRDASYWSALPCARRVMATMTGMLELSATQLSSSSPPKWRPQHCKDVTQSSHCFSPSI